MLPMTAKTKTDPLSHFDAVVSVIDVKWSRVAKRQDDRSARIRMVMMAPLVPLKTLIQEDMGSLLSE